MEKSLNNLLVIIDDEADILDLLTYNFSRAGFRVEGFERARPALEFVQKERPALILCDWMMPEMNGIEFCREVKSHVETADIPLIMVTCRNEKQARRTALAEGVSDYIAKPIRIPELMGRVNAFISR